MEFLLINHPLIVQFVIKEVSDLQDQAMAYGSGIGRYVEQKRQSKIKT